MKTFSFHISGMHCVSCASNIERRLRKLPGVAEAAVNYANEQATVKGEAVLNEKKLSQTIASLGYRAHFVADDSEDLAGKERLIELKKLRQVLGISGLLSFLLLLGMLPFLPAIFHQPFWLLILATPVQFWAGRRFYQGAWSSLKNFSTNMDTLVVLGTSTAYFYSAFQVFFPRFFQSLGMKTDLYFETAAVIITFILLGKYLEIRAKAKTTAAIKALFQLQPKTATVKSAGQWQTVPLAEIKLGDILLVKPGEKVPTDGEVVAGETTIDESLVTGESLPVNCHIGDRVIGGTLNQSGSIEIRATKIGSETLLAGIIRLVKEAQGSRPAIQALVDKIAAVFVPVVIVAAILAGFAWWFFGPEPRFPYAILSFINVLIIACPCALGLATPTSLLVGIGRAARLGILIKDAQSLEIANKIKAVVFDKTGTLTAGKPAVAEIFFDGKEKRTILALIKTMEERSQHPLAKALASFATEELKKSGNFIPQKISHFREISGKGVIANVNGQKIAIGNQTLIVQEKITLPAVFEKRIEELTKQSRSLIFVSVDDKLAALVAVADSLRPEAKEVITALQKMKITSILLSGDKEKVVSLIAAAVGIRRFFAQVLPEEKEKIVRELRSEFPVVAMVGDGINDAPALATADVGMAMGGGTDIAAKSAGVTLLRNDLNLIPVAIKLSRATMRNIKENLFWAFAYNVLLIPLAMGVFYPLTGWFLNPMLAGAAMAFSSVSVVGNALRLRSFKIN